MRALKISNITHLLFAVLALSGCGESFESRQEEDPDYLYSPREEEELKLHPEQILVGDMILDKRQAITKRGEFGTQTTAFEVFLANPWPGGAMPVLFDDSVNPQRQKEFWDACRLWTPFSGVRCVAKGSEAKFAVVSTKQSGCFASVGMPIHSNGIINLGEGCWRGATVLHEIGHAFGLIHEHQRTDRDQYIDVLLENVIPEYRFAYDIIPSSRITEGYDFDSIMHYWPGYFASSSNPTMVPKPQYAEQGRNMGLATIPSDLDRRSLGFFYNIKPPARVGGSIPTFNRDDFRYAMLDLNALYIGELKRPEGLTLNGGPDFLGIAAWIFDIYLTSLASGYSAGDAFYNVRAWITNSDEWKGKNPGKQVLEPLPVNSPISLDRAEYLNAMIRLDSAYKTELLRSEGLRIGNTPDFEGIAAWIFDIYLNARLKGLNADAAWDEVLKNIRASDEYKRKH